MGFFNIIKNVKDLGVAVSQDVLSMGGFWVVDGQTKTGEFLDRKQEEERLIEDLQKILQIVELLGKKK